MVKNISILHFQFSIFSLSSYRSYLTNNFVCDFKLISCFRFFNPFWHTRPNFFSWYWTRTIWGRLLWLLIITISYKKETRKIIFLSNVCVGPSSIVIENNPKNHWWCYVLALSDFRGINKNWFALILSLTGVHCCSLVWTVNLGRIIYKLI